jgi:TPR repeat protein
MDKNLRKLGWRVGIVVAFLVAFEAFIFLRWIFFSGREPSPLHDVETGLGILICLWIVTKIGGWFEQREARDKEILAKIRNIDTRIEALYKWGEVDSVECKEDDNDDWEWELSDGTKAEIAYYRKGIEEGDENAQDNLATVFWNQAMKYYNAHTREGYVEAVRWLRKAACLNYDCDDTLGDAYRKLEDYEEAMYWYRRSVRRGGRLVWIPESDIAEMYAEGHGVSQNHAEAARWWQRSAQHGSYWSHYKLGELYADGADGVDKDRRKAYFHLYIASSDTSLHSPKNSAVELRDKVEKELGEYLATQEKKRADEWLAANKGA